MSKTNDFLDDLDDLDDLEDLWDDLGDRWDGFDGSDFALLAFSGCRPTGLGSFDAMLAASLPVLGTEAARLPSGLDGSTVGLAWPLPSSALSACCAGLAGAMGVPAESEPVGAGLLSVGATCPASAVSAALLPEGGRADVFAAAAWDAFRAASVACIPSS